MSKEDHHKTEKVGILERKVLYSKWALFIERVWPALWPPVSALGLFTVISLTGIWIHLPEWAHKLGLALFGLLFIISLTPLLMCRWPSRKEALIRIEKASGLKHHPVSSYEDTIGAANPSRATLQLWQAHRKRLSETFDRLKAGFPRPRVDKNDPYALRVVLAIVLCIGILATGNLAYERISSAFKLAALPSSATIRLDAWITPPSYTQKAAIILNDGSKSQTKEDIEKRFIQIPENSVLIIRLNSGSTREYTILKSDKINYGFTKDHTYSKLEPQERQKTDKRQIAQYKIPLDKSISIKIRDGLRDIRRWQVFIQKDLPPRIELQEPVKTTARNSLHLTYTISDDYGVKSAKAAINRPGIVITGAERPLGEPPEFDLQIPGNTRERDAKGNTYKDLTAHPWAGLETTLTLSATDAAGQVTHTREATIVLPSRNFTNALARALIEQRQKLVKSPGRNRNNVMRALHALTISPENFITDVRIYLGIRTAYWRLRHNRDRASASSVVDQLWHLALYIEDGNLSEAERQMKLAQDQLAKSLREGASGEEIRKQLRELRNAIARFTHSLARKQKNNNSGKRPDGTSSDKTLSTQDLDRMLREIEQLAKSGARQQAAQMLNRLRNILENIQTNTAQQNQSNKEMMSSFEGLNKVISRQQKLLDETFTQKQNAPLSNGPENRKFSKRNQNLANRQQTINKMLSEILQSMKNQGIKPGQSLDQAEQAMKESGQSLGKQNLDKATQQQTLALDKLRRGARKLAQQLMKRLGQQAGQLAGRRDPFGRRTSRQGPDFGDDSVKIPEHIDVQRAREILQELRKRFGNSARPPVELDYLERLLRRF